MEKLNVAVIGCGFWGKNHARVFSELDDCNLSAVVDIDPDRAREFGRLYNVECYTNLSSVLKKGNVDSVSICTPTVTHAKLALEAIKAGKDVLIEKPMTSTIEEAEEVITAAKLHDVKIMVGFIERFNPAVKRAEELIRSGEIGQIVMASARRVSRWPVRIGDVGVVKDLAIHDIDLICLLFNDEVEQVYAVAGSVSHRFEDHAYIVLRFKKGAAFIEANWITPKKIRTLTLTGTEGIIQVEYIKQSLTVENNNMMYLPVLSYEEPLKLELSHFVKSILNDERPKPSGEDGFRALRICEEALKSAKTHRPQNLKK